MKELSIEEKAKAYDKAKYIMKEYLESGNAGVIAENTIKKAFPELEESDDERIRKAIVDVFKTHCDYEVYFGVSVTDILAWLEKQCEQKPVVDTKVIIPKFRVGDIVKSKSRPTDSPRKIISIGKDCYWCEDRGCIGFAWEDDCEIVEQKPADKVEPKFKTGDWVVDKNGIVRQILSYKDGVYKHTDGYSAKIFEDEWRLWDITKDAKDGDVLACNEEILLFKSYSVQCRISLYCWYNGQTNNFHSKGVDDMLLTTTNKICPATKEQRDTLMKTMADAEYTFDSEKKELNKIEQGIADNQFTPEQASVLDKHIDKFVEQKPTWSEEDEIALADALWCCKQAASIAKDENDMGNIWFAKNWLKSLKGKVLPQPKQKWSEEDEKKIVAINKAVEYYWSDDAQAIVEIQTWLKSLRHRSHWKPNEEQIKAIQTAIGIVGELTPTSMLLKELREQLKKLKG